MPQVLSHTCNKWPRTERCSSPYKRIHILLLSTIMHITEKRSEG